MESKVLEEYYPFEYICTWGHVVQNYFYFTNAAGKGAQETKLYTREASYISGLLREYAVVILNVQEERYKPIGHTRAKKNARGGWKKLKSATFSLVDKFKAIKKDLDEEGGGEQKEPRRLLRMKPRRYPLGL